MRFSKFLIIGLIALFSAGCSKESSSENLEENKQKNEGVISSDLSVVNNGTDKAILNVTITNLKHLTYDEVEVVLARYSYLEDQAVLNFVRRMEDNEKFDKDGKVSIDITSYVNDIAVTDGDGQAYVLLRDKEHKIRLDIFNELRIKIEKGKTYNVKLSAERKLTSFRARIKKNNQVAANQVVYLVSKAQRKVFDELNDKFKYRKEYDRDIWERTFEKQKMTSDKDGFIVYEDTNYWKGMIYSWYEDKYVLFALDKTKVHTYEFSVPAKTFREVNFDFTPEL